MKKTFIFLSLVLAICLFSQLPINVNAQSTYQWLLNPSFEAETNLVEDYSFESGVYDSGVTYGNWTDALSDALYENTSNNAHSGIYYIKMHYSGNENLVYNFTSDYQFMGSDLATFTFWMYNEAVSDGLEYHIRYYYTDNDYDDYEINGALPRNQWVQVDVLEEAVYPSPLKTISAFEIWFELDDIGNCRLDDFLVSLTDDEGMQTEILYNTEHWLSYGTFISGGTGNIYFNDTLVHWGSQSVYVVPNALATQYPYLAQYINGLNTSLVSDFGIWAYNNYSSGSLGGVRGFLYFNDGSAVSKKSNFVSFSTWQYFNFKSLAEDNLNKIITMVAFEFETTSGENAQYVWFDDATLTASIQNTVGIFSFILTPSPLAYTSNAYGLGFTALPNTAYTFLGTVDSGINGTFTVYASLTTSKSGIITNGEFSFAISKRNVANNTNEEFLFQINDGSSVTVFTVTALWLTTTTTNPPITPTEQSNQFMVAFPLILIFGIFVIPATYYLGLMGFVGGFSIASLIAVWTTLAPTWMIAFVILTDVVIIFFGGKRKEANGEE